MKNPIKRQSAFPYIIRFVRFSAGFSLIIAFSLIMLHALGVSGQLP